MNTTQILLGLAQAANTKAKEVSDQVTVFTNNVSASNIVQQEFNISNWKERIIEMQLKNDFAWNKKSAIIGGTYYDYDVPYDKGYITFVYDDCGGEVGLYTDIFFNKGIPLCYAMIPSRLNAGVTPAVSGRNVKDILKYGVSAGGEVLCHYAVPLTNTSTDAYYEECLITGKKLLVAAGFEINGIITAGGSGWDTADFAKCTRLCRPYYRYADQMGRNPGNLNNPYAIHFYHPRQGITSLAAAKTCVDSAALYNKWLVFYFHGSTDVSLTDMATLLDYIKTVSNITPITYKTMYSLFSSSKLEQRVAAIEQ